MSDRVGMSVGVPLPLAKFTPAGSRRASIFYQACEAPYKAKCLEKHMDRWAYGHSDITAAAYA